MAQHCMGKVTTLDWDPEVEVVITDFHYDGISYRLEPASVSVAIKADRSMYDGTVIVKLQGNVVLVHHCELIKMHLLANSYVRTINGLRWDESVLTIPTVGDDIPIVRLGWNGVRPTI